MADLTEEEKKKAVEDYKAEVVYSKDLSDLAKQQPGSAMDFMNAGLPGSASDMATTIPTYKAAMTLSDIAPEALRNKLGGIAAAPDLTKTTAPAAAAAPQKKGPKFLGAPDTAGIYSSNRRNEF